MVLKDLGHGSTLCEEPEWLGWGGGVGEGAEGRWLGETHTRLRHCSLIGKLNCLTGIGGWEHFLVLNH